MTQQQRVAYQNYIEQTLRETLLPYGEIGELWFESQTDQLDETMTCTGEISLSKSRKFQKEQETRD